MCVAFLSVALLDNATPPQKNVRECRIQCPGIRNVSIVTYALNIPWFKYIIPLLSVDVHIVYTTLGRSVLMHVVSSINNCSVFTHFSQTSVATAALLQWQSFGWSLLRARRPASRHGTKWWQPPHEPTIFQLTTSSTSRTSRLAISLCLSQVNTYCSNKKQQIQTLFLRLKSISL